MRRARPGDRGRLDRSGNPHRLGDHVTLEVRFGPFGEIVRVEGERYRDVDGEGVRTPFVGHFRDYVRGGMRIPGEGELEWILPEGRFSYWRGRVERVEYDFGR